MHSRPLRQMLLMLLAGAPLLASPCLAADTAGEPSYTNTLEVMKGKLGIEDVTVRVTAGGYMIDFRYRVVDGDKAAPLANRESKAYLLDHATKAKLLVPTTPKVGSLRQTSAQPVAGRVYGAMFANPMHVVKAGSHVTVVVGDCRIEDLVVQ